MTDYCLSKRNLGLDALKIICMIMIITYHLLSKGGMVDYAKENVFSATYYIVFLIEAFCYVMVNCYILVSGYFLCNQKFRLDKFLTVYIQMYFWSLFLYIVVHIIGGV